MLYCSRFSLIVVVSVILFIGFIRIIGGVFLRVESSYLVKNFIARMRSVLRAIFFKYLFVFGV